MKWYGVFRVSFIKLFECLFFVMNFLNLDGFDFGAKSVLVRVDVNSPVADVESSSNPSESVKKVVQINDRILSAAKTIKELSDRGAKVVVLAHQGRMGDKDYTELDQHAMLLSQSMGKQVDYLDDLMGEKAINAIKEMKDSQILMLKNVRSLESETAKISAEEHSNSDFVKTLEPLFDYFVNDAFSVSHRSQCSVVGFRNIPNLAGRNMEHELNNLSKVENLEKPCVYVFGGAKPDDVINLVKAALEKGTVDKILTSGFLGYNIMLAKGIDLGREKEFLEENGYLVEGINEFVDEAGEKIETPVDFAVEKEGAREEISIDNLPSDLLLQDIGGQTANHYAEVIKGAKTVYFKGPAGVIEDVKFQKGTEIIMKAVADSDAFSIMGGGHSLKALDIFGIDKSRISYVSLAGGALVAFIAGKELPGIKSLEESYERFK